jgi:hypothetical protein
MCVHNVDGQRGWTGECPDIGPCLCAYFPERGPAFPQPRQSTSTTSTAPTIVHIVVGVVAVVLALLTLGVWVIGTDDDGRRRTPALDSRFGPMNDGILRCGETAALFANGPS